MEDSWLDALQDSPTPAFASELRARLRQFDATHPHTRTGSHRLVLAAAVVCVVVVLWSVPSARAAARQFLSLFRVTSFVAVPVESNRFDALHTQNLDLDSLIGERVKILQQPEAPISFSTVDEAAAAVGFDVQEPAWQPAETTPIEIMVTGPQAMEVTADAARLEQVMDVLGITDLRAPDGLDGQTITIRVPPVVGIRYEHTHNFSSRVVKTHSRLLQAATPQVDLPANLNLASLGEIGLRILGLPAEEARQFAEAIDWQTTMIVPIPPTARSFEHVTVGGHQGVLVQYQQPGEAFTNMVLWSTGDRIFALRSIEDQWQTLAMANSVR
jgi:hypothetical protein